MAKKKQGLAAVEEMMSGEQPQVEETQETQAEETETQTQPEESNEAKEELVQAETNDNSSNDVPTETPQEVSTPSFFEEVGRTREEVEESLARADRFITGLPSPEVPLLHCPPYMLWYAEEIANCGGE